MIDKLVVQLQALPPVLPNQPNRYDAVRRRVARRRRNRRGAAGLATVVAVVVPIVIVAALHGGSRAPQTVRISTGRTHVTVVRRVELIDPGYGVALEPPRVSLSSVDLTADEAWAKYAKAASGRSEPVVPSRLSVEFGRLTATNVHNRVVYAYSLPTGCVKTVPTAKQRQCVEWTFVSANTGVHVLTDFAPIHIGASH